MRGGWRARVGLVFALMVLGYVAAVLFKLEPRVGPFLAVAAVIGAALWLAFDALSPGVPDWSVDVEPAKSLRVSDPELALQVRHLESHLTSARPDGVVRDTLRGLVDDRLAATRGLSWQHPAAADLLGPELLAVLRGEPRRLSIREIDGHVRQIEGL